MAKDLSFSTFLDEYDADFFDYLSKTSAACHSDKRYKELTEQIKTLYEQHPNGAVCGGLHRIGGGAEI